MEKQLDNETSEFYLHVSKYSCMFAGVLCMYEDTMDF